MSALIPFCPKHFCSDWLFVIRSAQVLLVASLPDTLPHMAPTRLLPSEQPVKVFTWGDCEGVQVDGDASSEDDGAWCLVLSLWVSVQVYLVTCRCTCALP